ncbi:MAG: invasion associated locus B family protein [Rhizomicrobium sp.]
MLDWNSTSARVTFGVLLVLVGLIAGWFLHRSLFATPNIPIAAQYDDWRLACPKLADKNDKAAKDATCDIQSDVVDDKSHTTLAQFVLLRIKDVDTLIVTVPYNILLEPGIGIAFDGDKPTDKPQVFHFEYCNGMGCVVRIPTFNKDLLGKMTTVKGGRILFAGLDGKPVYFPFSLKGFADAHRVFLNTEAKRHSWFKRLWS